MAGFTIPNAPDTDKSGLDQSEPDRLDFEILGNRRRGIVSGCEVTASSGSTVSVSAGTAYLDDAFYAVSSNAALVLTAAPTTGNRFDLVVARLATGTVTITYITGTASTTNPTFPTVTTNDVVLASVYRRASQSVVSNDIIDKRTFVPSQTTLSIVNADVNASAAIAYSKLNLASSITSADIVNGTIATADIADNAITTGKLATGAAQAGFRSVANQQTGTTYTLGFGDLGGMVELSNTSPITVTVPLNSGVAFTIGDRIDLLQTNTGQVTVQGASGVTVNSESNKTKLNGRWAAATLIKRDTNTWVLIGNIVV
jgi:hypothetical protein